MLSTSEPASPAVQTLEAACSLISPATTRAAYAAGHQIREFSVPWLARRRGEQLELFEETASMETPWRLSQCSAEMTESDCSPSVSTGAELVFDITEQGRVASRQAPADFLPTLQNRMRLFATDQGWTEAELVYWLDRAIYHPDITPSESTPFLGAMVRGLITQRDFRLEELVADKYRLSEAAAKKIDAHCQQVRQQAYQAYLLPDCATPLEVDPSLCFSYRPDEYPYNQLYRGETWTTTAKSFSVRCRSTSSRKSKPGCATWSAGLITLSGCKRLPTASTPILCAC